MTVRIAIPYFSGAGHTRQLAIAIAQGSGTAETSVIDVETLRAEDWQTMDAADAILFGSPTYMGGVAARYAAFLEEAGSRWMDQVWADKIAGGFTVATFGSGDKLACLQRMNIFAAQMGMVWVGPADIGAPVEPEADGINADGGWLGLMAASVRAPRGAVRAGDLETARRFGGRVARLAGHLAGARGGA
ncbi:MAG: flavodoxin family protein [Pseudomonadota bacterium]